MVWKRSCRTKHGDILALAMVIVAVLVKGDLVTMMVLVSLVVVVVVS